MKRVKKREKKRRREKKSLGKGFRRDSTESGDSFGLSFIFPFFSKKMEIGMFSARKWEEEEEEGKLCKSDTVNNLTFFFFL